LDAAFSVLDEESFGDNGAVPNLESHIDELYKLPLSDFVAARTALARTLTGTDAKRVKALPKPTGVPWAVNQLYWHARDAYERLAKAGQQLRSAQVAALEGKKGKTADVPAATDAHRAAVSTAAASAVKLAARAGVSLDLDEVARMLEALSLAVTLAEAPGRFTKPLTPAGFEALAGVVVKAVPRQVAALPNDESPEKRSSLARSPRADAGTQETHTRERELAERRRALAVARAKAAAEEAQAAEVRAREAWQQAKRALDEAERALRSLGKEDEKGVRSTTSVYKGRFKRTLVPD
jgi:hypothetical protein